MPKYNMDKTEKDAPPITLREKKVANGELLNFDEICTSQVVMVESGNSLTTFCC
jgi:hypothetical protein